MHFDAIGRVPGDPILGLMEAYASDSNPRKFDLGVGVYKDSQGLTPIPGRSSWPSSAWSTGRPPRSTSAATATLPLAR